MDRIAIGPPWHLASCPSQAVLRAALDSKDGARLQKALEEWRFEKDAPEYLEAQEGINSKGNRIDTYIHILHIYIYIYMIP